MKDLIKIQIQKVSLLAMNLRRVKVILNQKILPIRKVRIPAVDMMISVEELLGVKWLKVASQ